MQPESIARAMQVAVQHFNAGRLSDAELTARQVLASRADHPDALHLLGLIALQVGRNDLAIDLIGRAITRNPNDPAYHSNLGNALKLQGRLAEAVAAHSRAIQLAPMLPEAHNNLGSALRDQGRLSEAAGAFSRAIQLMPGYAEAHCNFASCLRAMGRLEEAVVAYRRAIDLKPDLAETWYNLGNALSDQLKLDDAAAAYARVMKLKPGHRKVYNNLGLVLAAQGKYEAALQLYLKGIQLGYETADTFNNLGIAYTMLGKVGEAAAAFGRATQLKPDYAIAHSNLGNALNDAGKLDDATAAYEEAIRIDATLATSHNNLGNLRKEQGRIEEAMVCFQRASALQPYVSEFESNRLFTMHFDPAATPASILAAHRRWNQRFAVPLKQTILPHRNTPVSDRRLKIGYVSPDLRSHPVGRFLLPILKHHDRAQFEVYCYANNAPDAMTEELRRSADQWRSILGRSDDAAAQQIREDGIDLLVDLTLHSSHNRLLVFVRKPAPVQATYLGYCSTTGLDAIDYRLTDPYLDPPGLNEDHYAEKSICLGRTWWCYQPDADGPDVGPLAALADGSVTFGCLNNFAKLGPAALATWCQILRTVPRSRLLLHAKEGSHRERFQKTLKQEGIDPTRVAFVTAVPRAEYLRLYHRIDIALDPFPWNGGTTTLDALWMGVPVITRVGRTAVGRAGLSILSNLGLPEWIAHTDVEYLRIATNLAGDLNRLQALRREMRERMRQSPLTDAPDFVKNLEKAYRSMWREWCTSQ